MAGSIVFFGGSLQKPPDRYAARPKATRLAVISAMFDHWVRLTPLYRIFGFVEERAPVRIGIRGGIVTIEVQRARIVTIVSIAQQFGTTQTAHGSSTGYRIGKRVQMYNIYFVSASQRANLIINLIIVV